MAQPPLRSGTAAGEDGFELVEPAPPERGVFANRTLNLRAVQAVGYDMDYTLIHYRIEEWERDAFEYARSILGRWGFPVDDLTFDPAAFTIGLAFDLRLGKVRNWLLNAGKPPCTSMGPLGVMAIKARELGLPGRSLAQCAQVPVSHWGIRVVTKRFVDVCHAMNMQVHVWTIDEPDEMRELIGMGVDGLMTDKPSVLKQVLVEMGRW